MSTNIQATDQTPLQVATARHAAADFLNDQYADCSPEVMNVYNAHLITLLATASSSKTWAEMPEDHRVELANFVTIVQDTLQAAAVLYYTAE